MHTDQHGDRFGDRSGQAPKVNGDSWGCVVNTPPCPHSRIDEILAIIDTGLQTAGDTAYGYDRHGICWRCQQASIADLCAPCRMELDAEVERPMPEDPLGPLPWSIVRGGRR